MKVSVVIPSFNSAEVIGSCLEALAGQSVPADEVLLIDSSRDDTPGIVRSRFHSVVVHHHDHQVMPGAGRNEGMERARGELILFTDTDAVPERDWIRHHVELHARHPDVALIGGAIVNGNPQSWISRLSFVSEFTGYGPRDPESVRTVVPTVNASIKRDRVREAGVTMPAEGLPGGEDVVFCERLRAGGLGILFSPLPVVAHLNRTTWERYVKHMRSSGFAAGGVAVRHGGPYAFLERLGPLTAGVAVARLAIIWGRVLRREPARLPELCWMSGPLLWGLIVHMHAYRQGARQARGERK